ncbi:MAG: hypothetical protein J5496_07230 [Lachnospiraceae bacterium]|nr:hypothetical protein [Lachnospiraceae bacterium]
MPTYIPSEQHIDRMPIDISFVFESERPAGKHGFCQRVGDRFVFEDGTPAKFFGVICNGASCFPEHDHAEKVARRLAQTGVNYVRFHQLDAEWCTPNLYRLTSGKRVETTRNLHPGSMERLDYWIKCLKEQGIYACIDMTTYRKFKSGDGVPFAVQLAQNEKFYTHFDERLIFLQKEFCEKFWNHVNPYTGLAYKDDPFFFACVISNEDDTLGDYEKSPRYGFDVKYYDDEFRDLFAAWLREQGKDPAHAYQIRLESERFPGKRWWDQNDVDQANFRMELEKRYAEEMYAHLRSLGVKIPIADTNWKKCNGDVKAMENMDFNAGNCYFYEWTWSEYEKNMETRHLLAADSAPLGDVASLRRAGHPFHITEWDMPWPNPYRAESAVWFPAIAALQDYVGMSIHTYCYTPHIKDTDLLGKEAPTNGVGSVPYREGVFTCWNDPAKFGLFYHGALMLRRGDVSPAKKTIASLCSLENPAAEHSELAASAMEIHKVVSVFDEKQALENGIAPEDIYPDSAFFPREEKNVIRSDTGEVWRDLKQKIGAVDTPRTKIVYGCLASTRDADLDPYRKIPVEGLTVRCNNDLAVIALSSLNDKPLCESDNILLTTVGRAGNTDMQFNGDKLVSYGRLPILTEVIDAEIELETSCPDLQVWAINSEGSYAGVVKSVWENGVLKFHVGPHWPSQYYLIMQE